MRVHCKACDGKSFNSVSRLRKHQWTDHREWYANTGRHQALAVQEVARPTEIVQEMSAKSLLAQLRRQSEFMHDVVTLVEGLIK